MNIIVVSRRCNELKNYFNDVLVGDKLDYYSNIGEFSSTVLNSALQTDLVLIESSSFGTDLGEIALNFNKLEEVINYKFFCAEKIIFIDENEDDKVFSRYSFLKIVGERKRVVTYVEPKYTKVHIYRGKLKRSVYKSLLVRDVEEYDKVQTNDVVVIQKRRGVSLDNTFIVPRRELDKDVFFESSYPKSDKENIKSAFSYNNSSLEIPITEPQSSLESLDEELVEDLQSMVKDKCLMVTGTYGVSTTAMVMGRSASTLGKTLLVDCCFDNMGISDLMDKLFIQKGNEDVSELNLTDIFDKGLSEFYTQSNKVAPLHVLRLELPFVRRFGDTIESVLLNVLKQLKDKYKYIILDLPLRLVKDYPLLISKYVDRIVMTTVPFENKVVNTISQLKESPLIKSYPYSVNKLYIMLLNITDKTNLPVISRKDFVEVYCKQLLGKEIPTTGYLKINKQDDYIRTYYFLEIMERESDKDEPLLKDEN